MTTTTAENNIEEPKIGKWRGGWLLLRSSWTTLKLDKELTAYPVMSFFTTITAIIVLTLLIALIVGTIYGDLTTIFAVHPEFENDVTLNNALNFIMPLAIAFVAYITSNYYSSALMASAIHRFQGNDPSVKYGLSRAKKRFGSIVGFSLLQVTVGFFLRLFDEKLPLVGRIANILAGIAWSLASLFVLPIIVMSEHAIGPFKAVKESAQIFKKVWGQTAVGGIGMSLIFVSAIFTWLIVTTILVAILSNGSFLGGLIGGSIIAIGFVFLLVIASTLNGIFIAALYHFATTGESPAHFDKKLLKAAYRPKKKWFK